MGNGSSSGKSLTGGSRVFLIGFRRGGQSIDNRAIRYVAAITFTDHICECFLQFSQVFDLASDRRKVRGGDLPDFGAGVFVLINQRKQFADFRLTESELAASTHKR